MKHFIIVSLMFISFSCTAPRYVYAPSAQNVPALEKKNDAEFSVNLGPLLPLIKFNENYRTSLDVQAAWAASDHFALSLNFSNHWEKDNPSDFGRDTTLLTYRRRFFEPSLGYFTRLSRDSKMQFQVFGGVGLGYSNITDEYDSAFVHFTQYHNSKVTKYFLQPAIIFKPTENFNAALSVRFLALDFQKVTTNYTKQQLQDYLLDSLQQHTAYFYEPCMTFTFGFDKFPVKIKVQSGLSILMNRRFFDYRSAYSRLGVAWDIKGKKKPIADSSARN